MAIVPLALRREPDLVLGALADEPGAFLLDVPDVERPVTLVGCRPVDELRVGEGVADPLGEAAAFVAAAPTADASVPFPLRGGIVGCFAYEAGRGTAPHARVHRSPVPLAILRRYDPLLVHDRALRQWFVVASSAGAARAAWLERVTAAVRTWDGALACAPLSAVWSAARHRAAVARVLDYLAAGDAYQVNVTQPFEARLAAPPWAVAARLRRGHPVPYGAYLDAGDFQVIVNSPELLLRRRGRHVETRPIKGTRPRSDDPASDAGELATLLASTKDRAEHVMIVDLERNDLGRVCETGTVRVARLLRPESHGTVHHLVSSVRGRLGADVDLASLLHAVFPGGSITGAPKVRAMEIIAELEDEARGVYTGAIGLLDPAGDLELALPIRTAVVRDGLLRYHAGGGIVADSDPALELAECWVKTAALRRALGEDIDTALFRCSSG